MANYYTKLSFILRCTADEAAHLKAAFDVTREISTFPECLRASFPPAAEEPADDFSGLAALYDPLEADYMHIGAGIDRIEEGVHIYADYSPQVEVIAELIRRLAPSALPAGFIWIGDCDRPRADAFSGGYAVIRADAVEYGSLDGVLQEVLKAR